MRPPGPVRPARPAALTRRRPAAAELPIQFQDVPITTAIESLARLAGINYLLDPKIGYGQPDATGEIKPEPTLSIRWEHVTAEQALEALLDNYGLQLVENPKTEHLQNHDQGSHRAAAADYPGHPIEIRQHFQHGGRRRKHR